MGFVGRFWVIAGLALVLAAPRAEAAWPRRLVLGCATAVVALGLGFGVSYHQSPTALETPEPPVLETPVTPPAAPPVTVESRVQRFDRLLQQGFLTVPLTEPYRFSVFTEGFLKMQIASGIKTSLHEEQPDLPEAELGRDRPGLHFRIDAIRFRAIPDSPDHVQVEVVGGRLQFASARPVAKVDLVGGGNVQILFDPVIEERPAGTGRVEARIALRYDSDRRCFEILEGRGSFSVYIAFTRQQVTEPVVLPRLVSVTVAFD